MYDSREASSVDPTPINRYAIGDRDELKYNADGSLDIYHAARQPRCRQKSRTGCPSPQQRDAGVTMRLYEPKVQVLDGAEYAGDQAGTMSHLYAADQNEQRRTVNPKSHRSI